MVVLNVLLVATLLEIGVIALRPIWSIRSYVVPIIIVGAAFGSGGFFVSNISISAFIILMISAYRVFNLLRISKGRINERFLLHSSRRSSFWFIGLQLSVFLVWWLSEHVLKNVLHWMFIIAGVQLLVAIILAVTTIRRLKKTLPITLNENFADRDLPSVTVAIPARNEDAQLEECLHSILNSDYPKLEVIVFDDCSQDRTSQIIRNFAHDGVLFIPGDDPKTNWLAKNQAYEKLSKEANGEIILFCGVDVRFSPKSIRQLVILLNSKKKRMISLMPVITHPGYSFSQTIRYYWELALPRRLFKRPPVMSSCWIIDSHLLRQSGGFTAVSNSITPEAHFARLAVQEDSYSFMRSTSLLGISSVKTVTEQKDTAVRIRYPQLHRRPELVFIVAFAELSLLFTPYVLLIIGFWGIFGYWLEATFTLICSLLTVTYRGIIFANAPDRHWYMSLLFPVTVLVDVCLLNYSMYRYEFSTVIWKGRNVCIPVMRVDQHTSDFS